MDTENKLRVGILGATGYTARVLIELLLQHPMVQIVALTSRSHEPTPIGKIHARLAGRLDLSVESRTAMQLASECDCIFSCLPHAASAQSLAGVDPMDTAIVDFSADYRLWDATTYQQWYGEHPDPSSLVPGGVPYGLPELYRDEIRATRFVANPGCYPTSAILAMAPLLKAQLVTTEGMIFDAKSGVSGAGRTPSATTSYCECNESFAAYKVGQHRHTPEIRQILSHVAGRSTAPIFTPHLVPMDRGILTTGYAQLQNDPTPEDVLDCLRQFYATEPFVRVVDALPATSDVVGSNRCHVTVRIVDGFAITVSCIDNLMKGASGTAVQNMNLMFGLEETMGLIAAETVV